MQSNRPETYASEPLFCIGHSHVTCLQEAALGGGIALTAINFWQAAGSLDRDASGAWQLSHATGLRIANHPGPIFSLVGGASYGVIGMLVHPRPWDFVLPWARQLPLSPGTELIPFDAVKALLLGAMQEYLDITRQVACHAMHGVLHIEPPPPYADAERITPHIPWGLYPGMEKQVAPALSRYKLWSLQSALLREHCASHGIGFLAHPAESADAQGFMRPEYFLDGAHANGAYGALVLQQMRSVYEAPI